MKCVGRAVKLQRSLQRVCFYIMAKENRRRFTVPDIDDAVSDFQQLGLMVFNRPPIVTEPAEPNPSVRPAAINNQQLHEGPSEDAVPVPETVTKLGR